MRPIPAGAGQPHEYRRPQRQKQAYPRRRGATLPSVSLGNSTTGLSPQARGNPPFWLASAVRARPIPAGAGQPHTQRKVSASRKAYPRRRGATGQPGWPAHTPEGLSPQARGNPFPSCSIPFPFRPIPAGAGQPVTGFTAKKLPKAYPRRRGATLRCSCGREAIRGLSPRARGNPGRSGRRRSAHRPIPAGAGQPDR